MGFKSYVDTIERKDTIEWITLKELEVKEKHIDEALKTGANDADNLKHCENLDKYNKKITLDEENFLKKLKDDVSSKQESISRTILKKAKEELSLMSSQFLESENFNIKKLSNIYKDVLDRKASDFKQNLGGSLSKYIRNNRHLARFQVLNNLNRDADYPKSKWLFWGIFFIVLVAEAIANSYFYAQGSDLGFLGGILQASLVALANVVLSFFIGFVVLRYLNHVNKIKKFMAFIGLILSFGLLFFLHLVTAHYRELLIKSPDNATSQVLKDTFNQPFNINDFESLILIIIGFGISILVIWKSYRFDDPYPGYGKVWRKWEKTQEAKNKDIKKFRDEIGEVSNGFQEDVEKLNKNANYTINYIGQILDGLHTYKATVDTYFQNTKENAMHIVRAYRQGYNKVAQKEKLLVDEDITSSVITYLGLDTLMQKYQEVIDYAQDVKDKIDNEIIHLSNNKDKYINDVEYMIDELKDEDKIESMIDEVYQKETKDIEEREKIKDSMEH